jgi:predicted enzyme related to lactoylglutathione lyase
MQKNAISWFEIPSLNLAKAKQFYESILQIKMQPMTMGPSECAVFPYDEAGTGVGGAIICGPTAPVIAAVTHPGVLIYLYSEHTIEVLLQRAIAAGGKVAMPRTALPPGLGFMASIVDLDGNIVGLHALS